MLFFYLAALETDEQKSKFEYIYCTYYKFMLKVASTVIKDKILAEDAVHETFIQILREIDLMRIENEKELKTYLYILTKERTIDFLRKWERHGGKDGMEPPENLANSAVEPENIVLTNIKLSKAIQCMVDMPEIYKKALALKVKGYSIKEIAEITDSSESNVKSRIYRARQMIIQECKDEEENA